MSRRFEGGAFGTHAREERALTGTDETYDLLVAGGRVLDPGQGLDAVLDIAVAGGRVARLAPGIDPDTATRVVDASGCLVTPGLIDLHAHVAGGLGMLPAEQKVLSPDVAGVDACVTTVVDAGSTGASNVAGLVNQVLPRAKTRIIVYINVGACGTLHTPEVRAMDDIDPAATVAAVRARPDVIRGVKARMVSPSIVELGMELPQVAKKVASEAGVPLMVHVGDIDGRNPIATDLTRRLLDEVLTAGDIVTHTTSHQVGALLRGGELMPEAQVARQRGVVFDTALGRVNFSFEAAKAVLGEGFVPDTISTDSIGLSRFEIVHSLVECMSKFLALGLSLEDVVRMTTSRPAEVLGMENEIGVLKPGCAADISILEIVEGDWVFRDGTSAVECGTVALQPRATVRAGGVVPLDYGPRPWGWLPESA